MGTENVYFGTDTAVYGANGTGLLWRNAPDSDPFHPLGATPLPGQRSRFAAVAITNLGLLVLDTSNGDLIFIDPERGRTLGVIQAHCAVIPLVLKDKLVVLSKQGTVPNFKYYLTAYDAIGLGDGPWPQFLHDPARTCRVTPH